MSRPSTPVLAIRIVDRSFDLLKSQVGFLDWWHDLPLDLRDDLQKEWLEVVEKELKAR